MAQEKQQTTQEDETQKNLTRHKIKKSLAYLDIAVLLIIIIVFAISSVHISSYFGKIKIDNVCKNLQKDVMLDENTLDIKTYSVLEDKMAEIREKYLIDSIEYIDGKTVGWTRSNGFFSGPSDVGCDVSFRFCIDNVCNDAWHTQLSINWEDYQEWHSQ